MFDATYFDELRIGLATADQIRMWSNGEVKKPETINYRTLKPEKDGLFCERIFGPTRDWECYCGKYKRVRFKGIICERCGVEVTRSKVRRERMAHIELAAPVTHIWYFKGVPSRLGYLLDIAPKDLERVIYFDRYMITWVEEDKRHKDLPGIQKEIALEKDDMMVMRDKRVAVKQKEHEKRLKELETEGAKAAQLRSEQNRFDKEIRELHAQTDRRLAHLDEVIDTFSSMKPKVLVPDEMVYRELKDRFGEYFRGYMGAEAIKDLLDQVDVKKEFEDLRVQFQEGKGARRARAVKRLRVVSRFVGSKNAPSGMVLDCIPVIPPDLRPMVQLDGGRFATSDLNDLYRRVINRNNRLKRLLDLGAPEIIVNNEKRMLQEAVDALFDNGRRGRPVTGPGNRALKSLSDMLKGKQGRFRQNLLGKRVDYSGRSVIVVGPELKLHQCGLPKQMALELFKPFVMKQLVDLGHAQNIKSAKRMVERARPVVWDVLEQVIGEHPVLLNRAPTLHRLGIQAFEPVLVEGKAIQIHPLVCSAFNADFDGDQMAVHLPLSAEAQAEARMLMLSSNNILSPAHGGPVALPTQDMVLGIYFLTLEFPNKKGEGKIFSSPAEAVMALDAKELHLHAPIKIRWVGKNVPVAQSIDEDTGEVINKPFETTVGRVLFNERLPLDYPYVNQIMKKKQIAEVVRECIDLYDRFQVEEILDGFKELGFHFATRAGVTIGIEDVLTPTKKQEIVKKYEAQANDVDALHAKGVITDIERHQEVIEIWNKGTSEIDAEFEKTFPATNSVFMMADSGARGSLGQFRQISGFRGLVVNSQGDLAPRPIKSSFREGLTVAEYYLSTFGARKGLADTALRTAQSGYLTRKLVDVSQDVIVRDLDCGTDRGIMVPVTTVDKDGSRVPAADLDTRLDGRVLAADVWTTEPRRKLFSAGDEISDKESEDLIDAEIESVKVRSVLNCETLKGVCATCYGRDMATGRLVEVGEAVGIIAAQSIGEPGTQLSMRTFHTGGVVGGGADLTGGKSWEKFHYTKSTGLPRVTEIFEARRFFKDKNSLEGSGTLGSLVGATPISEISGEVDIYPYEPKTRSTERQAHHRRFSMIKVTGDDGEEVEYGPIPPRARILVTKGGRIDLGQPLVEGVPDPHEYLRILGLRETQAHLVMNAQQVYAGQGVRIHDKHMEVIVRQMLRRVQVISPGDTDFLPAEFVERRRFEEVNRKVVADGAEPASARPILMGITKAALATDSWLSAASFQETTRILTEAAISGKSDQLVGLKENVILGKLIPAGTGMNRYRGIDVYTTEVPARPYAVSDMDESPLLDAPMRPVEIPLPPQLADLDRELAEKEAPSTGTEGE